MKPTENKPALNENRKRSFNLTQSDSASAEPGLGKLSRRDAMKTIMAASAAFATGLGGCERKPIRQIVSRVNTPEYQKPGASLYYSSTWANGEFPYGLMIKAVDGRPIKIEGNPSHPVNMGSSTAVMQASTLSLYDPDRMKGALINGSPANWETVDTKVQDALKSAQSVALFTRSGLGPSERALIDRFLSLKPGAKHFVHESAHDGPRRAAWNSVFEADGEFVPRFDEAKIILSLDSDFMVSDSVSLESIRGFVDGRSLSGDHKTAEISKFFMVESGMTVTGGNADHRLRLRPSKMGYLAGALRAAVDGDSSRLHKFASDNDLDAQLLDKLVAGLTAHRGEALVVAGGHLPPAVHAQVALLNENLKAFNNTLTWNSEPPSLRVSEPAEIAAYMNKGVDVAIFVDVNPVYDWPGGGFEKLLDKARLSISHGLLKNETQGRTHIALSSAHLLESWNDARARKGIDSLCQPIIAPLFDSRQSAESLLKWTQALCPAGDPLEDLEDWHHFIKQRWTTTAADGTVLAGQLDDGLPLGEMRGWEKVLKDGGLFAPVTEQVPVLNRQRAMELAGVNKPCGDYELVIKPHHAVCDGRYANNAWLQELPDPVSKVVWDNGATISPMTARTLGVKEGDFIKVTVAQQTLSLPAIIEPGVADRVIHATLGHGRLQGGEVMKLAAGVNTAMLLGVEEPAVQRLAISAMAQKTAGHQEIVRVQETFSMHERPIVLEGTLQEYQNDAHFVDHKRHLPPESDMWEDKDYSDQQKWGLSIDLNACVGCNACVTACQSENNIPVVGRDECSNGREMHWMRIDRYVSGDPENPTVHNQPMLCQHCDHAPCETVCPVNATSHSPEGLNEMTYNRCVGTRYCSNNCPYKVRRFNFYRYHERQLKAPVQELVFNPQVTVRGVGVMEKCTFCVQRISAAKYDPANKDKDLADGTVMTACQQACPAGAIRFGNVNDKGSVVAKHRKNPRAFHVLEELNVKPNVTYLARVRNVDDPAHPSGTSQGRHHS